MLKSIQIFRILVKSFGFKLRYIVVVLLKLILGTYAGFTIFLDNFFFPGSKLKKPVKPVFLIGHPRSGTTFLHRYLAANCDALRAMYLCEMIFPSLTARKIANRFKEKLAKISFDKIWNPKIHKTGMYAAETEDVALFVKYGEGFLPWFYFYVWDKFKDDNEFEEKLYKVCRQDKFVDYLLTVHQKNLYKSERKMLCKSFALIFNIDRIVEVFPDVKILLMMRDPKSVLPSTISLISGAQKKINGLDTAPEEKRQEFYQKVYKTTLAYYKLTDKIIKENRENVMLITHKQLLSDFDVVFRQLMEFYEVTIDEKVEKAIQEQVEKQKVFKSEHKYALEDFGLNEKQIEKDFAFIYENYDVA